MKSPACGVWHIRGKFEVMLCGQRRQSATQSGMVPPGMSARLFHIDHLSKEKPASLWASGLDRMSKFSGR
jgi:hypothetical protein